MKNKNHESTKISYSSSEAIKAREEIYKRLLNYPATDDEAERSLGLFLRGSLLARIMATFEIYQKIIELPGCILDLGTWRGQTAVLCENFRAIAEPLHLNRRIVCFDTFEGYQGFSDKDKPTEIHQDGTYATGGLEYQKYLEELLVLHEKSNAMGHINQKHRVIKGDCRLTLPAFLRENQNEMVACAFLDFNSYEPTKEAIDAIWSRLVPGGVVALWQLTRDLIPAEGSVYNNEILNKLGHTLKRATYYPGLCYLIKD